MFADRWKQILNLRGDDVALWHPGGALSFRALETAARALPSKICGRLGRHYLAQGDGPEITTALLAGFLTGRPVQLVEKDRSRRVPACCVPRNAALVKQTVGSSGVRRCQFFTFAQVAADVDRLHDAMGLNSCDVALAPLSVAHSFGLTTTVLQTLLNGLPTHWLPTPFPCGMTEALGQHERVFLPGVPAMWKAWLLSGLDLSRVKLAVSAGSPLTLELEAKVRETFHLKLHNLYGTSETGAISYDTGNEPRTEAGDLGTLLPGVQAAVENGRLVVASDAVGLGYDTVQPGELFSLGRHRTWDRITLRGNALTYDACEGPGINVASRKLSPAVIAEKIRTATGVRHVRIHGQPSRDAERVQDVVACLGVTPEQLTCEFKSKACAALAPWEVPRHWRIENPGFAASEAERSGGYEGMALA
ncbi:AMP-binding protein [Prosthecobacter sp. SYSU 5D2]|uniref:AMP-binding protein n=1 Tax=Prosthecobacter sp. SYSU 5D2 TaxID=3134134 RepID=UPI0031FE793A